MASQTVLILDFGGQYKELIARRVRECHVYSLVKAGDISPAEVKQLSPIGIILTGGPNSVYKDGSPRCHKDIFPWASPCWASAMETSCWPGPWAARWSPAM